VDSLVCKQAPGKLARHHALNDVVARAFSAAGIPIFKEPAGLCHTDGRRPDGISHSMADRQAGCLGHYGHLYDCTVIFGLIIPRGSRCSRKAASCKMAKYSNLAAEHTFFPIAVESHGPLCKDAYVLLLDVCQSFQATSEKFGFCISGFQLCSVLTLCCYTIVFLVDEQLQYLSLPFLYFFIIFFSKSLGNLFTLGIKNNNNTIFYLLLIFFQNPTGSYILRV